ncbi:MAG TPA: N-acetylneuraminate synthase [Candidatus Acetatifactor stercoripullorum]|uniref:N-acetylneuraminate synthase n=1 Tax=Candidatus Acetatifactor stercoripullorum TaxID=2838414 RepID=A0A9D1R4J2_9FIRM|nr:N-acetylneuraminate synthase [uncultured Acetatifactor sp.]HIW80363.1 N-acetylneuraminate synthase [Candidatus Acetatifactor stercoripullorum]
MKHVFVIAEAGVNHNGSLELAKKLADKAKEAGADAVKFQTFRSANLVCKNAEKADYQRENGDKSESQLQMLQKLELTAKMHEELKEYCEQKQIMFLSTPFDMESIDLLEEMGMPVYKIPSGEITNLPYLRKIGSLRKKVILSSGMSNLEEIKEAVKILRECGTADISVLHCNTQYPTPMEDVNLNVMQTLRKELGLPVGYSDHTKGIEVPIAAAALGAEIIEKHFTLDKEMDGPDHKASLEPEELKQMITAIRNIEKALGSPEKKVTDSERANIAVVRKSIVAKKPIRKGECFTEDNITTKRPGNGISPMLWDSVIGQAATRDYDMDEMIEG